MAVRPPGRTGPRGRSRSPVPPALPTPLEPATPGRHDLEDEAAFTELAFAGGLPAEPRPAPEPGGPSGLSGRTAESVEFERCGFHGADLSGTSLARARFTDCLVEKADLANLRVERSSMLRVRLSGSRMTGLHWVDGTLRDVVVTGCRADLSVFRFTGFHRVRFEDCVLTRADFQNAQLGGAEFADCDLTGAQFSYATMEGTRFRHCELAGIGGVTSFGGAVITGPDLVALSYTLAAGLGIRIEDADEES